MRETDHSAQALQATPNGVPAATDLTADPMLTVESPRAETEDPGLIGALDLLVPIIRRRRLLLLFTLAGLLVGMLWSLRKGVYYAVTTVLPPQSSVTSSLLGQIGSLTNLVGGGGLSGGHGSQDLYVSLLQSPSVQDAVVRRFSLNRVYKQPSPEGARAALARHTIIDGFNRDGMIRVIIHDDEDPKRAAMIANGYVDEFVKFMSRLAVTEAGQRRMFFEEQMQKEKTQLEDAEAALTKTVQKTGAIQLDAQTRILLDSAASLRAQVAGKQVQIESIRAYAGPDNIALQRAEQELAGLRAQLAKVSNSGGDVGDSMAASRNAIPQTALDNVRAQREVKYHETIFSILSNQYEAARLDEAREGAAVQVVEPATPPEGRYATPPSTKMIVSALVGLFVGLIYVMSAYGWERMRANRLFAGKLHELHNVYISKS